MFKNTLLNRQYSHRSKLLLLGMIIVWSFGGTKKSCADVVSNSSKYTPQKQTLSLRILPFLQGDKFGFIDEKGKVIVKRPDAQELNDIRNGKFTYPELIEYAEQLKEEVRSAEKTSPLPSNPDYHRAENLLIKLIKNHLDDLGLLK